MGNQIHTSRVGERFSSHTRMSSNSRPRGTFGDKKALREKLIAALVEVVAEGGDPRLV